MTQALSPSDALQRVAYLVNCLLYLLPPPLSSFRQAQIICPTLLARQQAASQGVWQL